MKTTNRLLLPVFFLSALLLVSCGHSAPWNIMQDVETYMEERPDSALAVLEGIDHRMLRSRRAKAKYSLLLSMAFDKNYIDKTDFSVLQPAVDWYRHHGSRADRFLARYYEATIYVNAGDEDTAMDILIAAEKFAKAASHVQQGRLYIAQAKVYKDAHAFDRAVVSATKALDAYGRGRDTVKCAKTLHSLALYHIALMDKASAADALSKAYELFDRIPLAERVGYYNSKVIYCQHFEPESIVQTLEDYVEAVPATDVDWLIVADAYRQIGELDSARLCLGRYDRFVPEQSRSASYQHIKAQIALALEDFKPAAEAYDRYLRLVDRINSDIVHSEIRFIRDRHEHELSRIKSQNVLLTCALLIVAALVLGYAGFRLMRNRYEAKSMELNDLKRRFFRIKKKADKSCDQLNKQVAERQKTLNAAMAAAITNRDNEIVKNMKDLVASNKSFVESTKSTFMLMYPAFMRYLYSCGMNEAEVGICCMYCLGLNAAECGDYLNKKSIYNINGRIRKTLGLSNRDTNLNIYLQKLMEEKG